MNETKPVTQTVAKKSGMQADNVETYRKAIAPFQERFEASKAARMEAFRWMKARADSPETPPLMVVGCAGELE